MAKRFIFSFLFSFRILLCLGSHLVGGEFEVIHLHDNFYLFRQIQYFDVLTGNPDALDEKIDASIFRSSDDIYVMNVEMPLIGQEEIKYSNPSCEDDRIVTRRQIYETTLELDPDLFSDPEGYYMVWERCCRNITISNIVNPDETGQTFYVKFPGLIKNGKRFYDSTPQLFPPLRDYACINQFYYADFRGTDADGDSLVYSLVTPLNCTISDQQDPVPTPSPAPHPAINWASGFGVNNQVPGNDPLKISSDGILTVTPSQTGLFVFSVKVEEYRNNEKIGEVRRDYQLLVVDCPPPGNKPEAKVKASDSDTYQSDLGILNINYGESTCFDLIVNDRDGDENIRLKAVPVNFPDSLGQLSVNSGLINDPQDTLKFTYCFPQCINDGSSNPAIVDVYVYDDQCPQSLMDTLRIVANIQQPPNTLPEITAPLQEIETKTFFEGSGFSLPFVGVDSDGDNLSMDIVPVDFDFSDYGITIDTLEDKPGKISCNLNWDTDCVKYPLGDKNEFDIMVVLEDFDECLKPNADTAYYHINITLPPNNSPVISVNGWPRDTIVDVKIEELKNFLVKATDADATDQVTIRGMPLTFDFEDYGINFPTKTGIATVQQLLPWQLFCGEVDLVEDTFSIQFFAEDADKCKVNNSDTLTLTINMQPPANTPPQLTINGQQNADSLVFAVGQEVKLDLAAFDPDNDGVNLFLSDADSLAASLGVSFSADAGQASASGKFSWLLSCEHLNTGFRDSSYTFSFLAYDNKCYTADTTIKKATVVVQDIFANYDFSPPNAFTPNAEDDINKSYYIPNLPVDNCFSQFEEIIIYNRWGKEVFRSENRDFHWTALEDPSGVYYYSIIYSHKTFKGIINLLK